MIYGGTRETQLSKPPTVIYLASLRAVRSLAGEDDAEFTSACADLDSGASNG